MLAIAQLNSRIGDFRANLARLESAVHRAAEGGATLVVAPELAVCGYPPRDLLFNHDFVEQTLAANRELARRLKGGPDLLVGSVLRAPHGLYNAALLLRDGELADWRAKQKLPSYDVFHEHRWFVPGPPNRLLDNRGVLICEDLWHSGYPPAEATELLCLNASPYRQGIHARRLEVARQHRRPLVYVNAVGGQDELIFDGHSFVMDADGQVTHQLPRFEECLQLIDTPYSGLPTPCSPAEELFDALTLGIRDFVRKNGIPRIVLGLSGGIDSALAACLAREAVGPERVLAVAIPSRYTDPRSTSSAEELARGLGIEFKTVELEPLHAAAEATLGPLEGTGAENLQARLRALILLAELNRGGGMLLNTSNKTELTLGYGTLHGDLAGTLSPLGDLTKPQVIELAGWFQAETGLIPPFILERPPSAELRPDQVDPFDYATLAPEVERLIQAGGTNRAEFKRREFGIVLKVSEKAFGSGRMIPVTMAASNIAAQPLCSTDLVNVPTF